MAANVVEVVVQATNATGPGFAAAKAGADETAAAMDTLAAASDRVTAAQVKYAQTTGQLLDAQLRLAEVEGKEGATEAEIAAAKDKVTAATLRQADAQIALVDAEAKQETAAAAAADASVAGSEKAATAAKAQADATKAAGDAAVVSGAKSDEAGGLMAGMGAKLKMAATGIAIGMAVAVDQAAKFQDSTTHLVTDAGESAKNLAMVQQGILGVAAATGTSAGDITNAMYHIESGGFHAANGLAILKTVAEGAKVGGADLDTTSKALIGTLTAYYGTSMTAAQATQRSTSLMNQLIQTVGSGDMRMQDLAAAIHSVAPVAAAAGISFAQVGGAIATMTAQGMSADQVTQDLGHVIGSLASPTNVMAVEMKAMGLNANSVAKNLGKTGLSGTIDELRDAVLKHTQGGAVMLDMLRGMSPAAQDLANKILAGTISTHDLTAAMKELNPQQYTLVSHFKSAAVSVTGMQQTYTAAMSKMLGGQMGLNVGLMLTGKHMQDVQTATDNIAAAGAKASGTVDNWSTIQGTFAFKMEQTKASLQATGIALGSALLPAVTAVLGPLARFLSVIAGNKTEATAFAVVVGGLLAGALGLKLASALKDAKEGITAVGEGIGWLIGKMTAQTVATDALTAAKEESVGATEAAAAAQGELDVAMDANPIGLIVIAIAALIAVIVLLVTHTHEVAHVFDMMRHDVAAAVDDVVNFVKAHWMLLLGILLGPIALAVAAFITYRRQIVSVFEGLWHDVSGFASRLASDVLGFFTRMANDVTGAERKMISTVIGDVRRWFSDWISAETSGLDTVVHWFAGLPGRIVSALGNIGSLLFNAGKSIIQGLINGVTSMVSAVSNTVSGIVNDIKSFLPFSPAKRGPLSGSGSPENSGRSIAMMLASGMSSGAGPVRAAAAALAGSAGISGSGGALLAGAGATGSQHTVTFDFTGNSQDMFVRAIRNAVRVTGGGNVQKAFGTG